MKFKTLSEYFRKLESTSSRNTMVEVLAGLFKESDESEIDKIIYLLQGRVAPLFEPLEFGMADKMIIRVLAKISGEKEEQALSRFKKTGDLGAVAEELRVGKQAGGEPNVEAVFKILHELAVISGEGSVEKKISLLSELLSGVDPNSAKYIARIPVDKLRLGFSDMTILEAFSWMLDGTKTHKAAIESVYNIRPDLGYIARALKQEGMRGISRIKPKIGTPILPMRAERLTNAVDILQKIGGECAVEPKIDGFRLQLHFKRGVAEILEKSQSVREQTERIKKQAGVKQNVAVELFSRGLEHVTTMYPEIAAAAEKELEAEEVVLDGEAIGYDPKTGGYRSFQETVQRKRKYDIEEFSKSIPLKLVVFDCLYLNGESLIDKPYTERREKVEKLLSPRGTLVPAEMTITSDPDELETLFRKNVEKGLEGIMAKKLSGVYQAGARGWNWIKLKKSYESKLADTVDAVVMGLDYGQGKRNKFGVGAFLVGIYDQKTDSYKTISKIGTGLTDEEWRELAAKGKELSRKDKPDEYDVRKEMSCDLWLSPKLVGEFRADELTKSPMHTAGFALRFPRLERWREKNPQDSTSLREIEEMVKLQKK